jgi:hypothetical protein
MFRFPHGGLLLFFPLRTMPPGLRSPESTQLTWMRIAEDWRHPMSLRLMYIRDTSHDYQVFWSA